MNLGNNIKMYFKENGTFYIFLFCLIIILIILGVFVFDRLMIFAINYSQSKCLLMNCSHVIISSIQTIYFNYNLAVHMVLFRINRFVLALFFTQWLYIFPLLRTTFKFSCFFFRYVSYLRLFISLM